MVMPELNVQPHFLVPGNMGANWAATAEVRGLLFPTKRAAAVTLCAVHLADLEGRLGYSMPSKDSDRACNLLNFKWL
jgi:hypothetical protein